MRRKYRVTYTYIHIYIYYYTIHKNTRVCVNGFAYVKCMPMCMCGTLEMKRRDYCSKGNTRDECAETVGKIILYEEIRFFSNSTIDVKKY